MVFLFWWVVDLLALSARDNRCQIFCSRKNFISQKNESQVFSSNNSISAKVAIFWGSVLFLKNTYDRSGSSKRIFFRLFRLNRTGLHLEYILMKQYIWVKKHNLKNIRNLNTHKTHKIHSSFNIIYTSPWLLENCTFSVTNMGCVFSTNKVYFDLGRITKNIVVATQTSKLE